MRRLEQITPAGFTPVINLTMTDDYPVAEAVVIISAVPNPNATVRPSGQP